MTNRELANDICHQTPASTKHDNILAYRKINPYQGKNLIAPLEILNQVQYDKNRQIWHARNKIIKNLFEI